MVQLERGVVWSLTFEVLVIDSWGGWRLLPRLIAQQLIILCLSRGQQWEQLVFGWLLYFDVLRLLSSQISVVAYKLSEGFKSTTDGPFESFSSY